MYSQQVLDHFQHPRNAGDLPDADVTAEVENPACGDILRLAANVQDGRLQEVRFKARGCVAAVAAASALTELLTRCPDFEVDESGIVWSGGSYVRRPLSVPITVKS